MAEKVIEITGFVQLHSEYLFSVYLEADWTYRLWVIVSGVDQTVEIGKVYNGTGEERFSKLIVHKLNAQPEYQWQESEYNIRWYATYNEQSPESGIPVPSAILISTTVSDKIYFVVEFKDWLPNSDVDIYLVHYGERKHITTITVDSNGYAKETIVVDHDIPIGDVLYAEGYDKAGNLIQVKIFEANETLVTTSWVDQALQWFNALYHYAGLIFTTVVAVIPYAGVFYGLALIGAFMQCLKELSISPLYDFFYKQYSALIGLANLTIKIAEKVYQGIKAVFEAIFMAIVSRI